LVSGEIMLLNPVCRTFITKLSPFVDGELRAAERVQVESHLAGCAECTHRVASLRAESALIRDGLELLTDEVDLRDFSKNVMARIARSRPPLLERWGVSYWWALLIAPIAVAATGVLIERTMLSRLYKLEAQGFDGKVKDPTDKQEIITKKAAAVARSYEDEPIPIGVYYEIDLPTYEDEVFRRIPDLKETPLVEQNAFERDVNPLLEAMR